MNMFNSPLEDGKIEKSLVDGLGAIQVQIQRVTIKGQCSHHLFEKLHQSESKSINEKAKKALITHSVE